MDFGGKRNIWKSVGFSLSLVLLALVTGADLVAAQIINEVMYETSSPPVDKEFVELMMLAGAINLSNYTIGDSNQNDTLQERTFNATSPFAVIVPQGSNLFIHAGASVYEVDDSAIGNGLTYTDVVTLFDPGKNQVDTLNITAFPQTNTDFSLERVSQTHFAESLIINGTPGKKNSVLNNPPILSSIGNHSVQENAMLTIQLTASDPDNDPLVFGTNAATVLPSNFFFDTTSGLFNWTPTFNDAGNYSVTFTVSDGIATVQEVVTIFVANINQAPQFAPIPKTTIPEDTTATINLSQYASDPDNDPLTFAAAQVPPANLTVTIDQTTGIATIAPDPNFFGARSIIFIAQDPALLTASTVAQVEVTSVNDPPIITSSPNLTATQDILYTYNLQAIDAENDSLTITLASAPGGMKITSEGNLTWTPNNTQVQPTPVNITVFDGTNTTEQPFTITVINVNDPPVINSTPVTSVEQNSSYVYQATADDPDFILGTEVLTFSLTQAPAQMGINSSTGLIAWVPQANQIGSNTVTAKVTDTAGLSDNQTFTINVTNINDPPTAPQLLSPINGVIIRDPTVLLNWTNSTDPDPGTTITYGVFLSNDRNNLTFLTRTTATSFQATNLQDLQTYFWQVIATDGSLNASSTIETFSTSFFNAPSITVLIPSTTTPTIKENEILNFSVQVTDPDGDNMSGGWYVDGKLINISVVFLNATQNESNFTYTPSFADAGKHNITFLAVDITSKISFVSFNVTVNNINRPPQLNAISNQTTAQSSTLAFTVTADDQDIQFGDVLTYTANDPLLNITKKNETEASVSFTPTNSEVGTRSVTMTVEDTAGATDNKTFTITVNNTNDPPAITSTPATTATVNIPYAYTVTAADPDLQFGNEALSFNLTTSPSGMTITKTTATTADIAWTSNASQLGSHNVNIRVTDTAGATANQPYTIQVSQLGTGAIVVLEQFDETNPTFGSSNQEASNPQHDDTPKHNIFVTKTITVMNGGQLLPLSNFTIKVSPKTGFTTNDLNITVQTAPSSLAPGQNGPLTLRARIPEMLDAVDQEGKVLAFAVADLAIDAIDSLGAPLTITFEVFMQRSNELKLNDLDAKINGGGGKSIDDGDDLEKIKPRDRIELDTEAENEFDDRTNLDIEDVDLSIACDDESEFDFDDKTEEIGDISTEDEETETITFDVEEDAKDGTTQCQVMIRGADENGAFHGETIRFSIDIERESHDLQIEDTVVTPNTITCETDTITLSAAVRNLGKSNEDDVVVEVISRGLKFQTRMSAFELDEDDTEDITLLIPVPEELDAETQAIQVKTFYDSTRESDAEVIRVENQCSAKVTIATKESGTQPTPETVLLSVGQSSLTVKQGEFVSIPVTLTNPGEGARDFTVTLANTEDFAVPAAGKRLFLAPKQTTTVFVNLQMQEDAPLRTQSATILVSENARVLTAETVSLQVEEQEKATSITSSLPFIIIGNFLVILIIIFLIDKFMVRKY